LAPGSACTSLGKGIERCTVNSSVNGKKALSITSLGLSVGTDYKGISSNVIEYMILKSLKSLGQRGFMEKLYSLTGRSTTN